MRNTIQLEGRPVNVLELVDSDKMVAKYLTGCVSFAFIKEEYKDDKHFYYEQWVQWDYPIALGSRNQKLVVLNQRSCPWHSIDNTMRMQWETWKEWRKGSWWKHSDTDSIIRQCMKVLELNDIQMQCMRRRQGTIAITSTDDFDIILERYDAMRQKDIKEKRKELGL